MSESGVRTPSFRHPLALGRAVVRHALAADVPFMAGAIAYQAFVSVMPLLFLLVVVTAAVSDENLTKRLLTITADQFPKDARSLVRKAVRNAVTQTGNSIVGVLVLGFGSFAVFNGLDKAFTDLYATERGGNLPNQLRDAFVVLAALGTAVIAITITWPAIAVFRNLPFATIVQPVLLATGLFIAFYPMFYVFPEVSIGWREAVPGVVVTAIGWTALQALFRFYVEFVARSGAFGVVSSVLVLATWLYFSGFVLLIGATLNAVLHGVDVDTVE